MIIELNIDGVPTAKARYSGVARRSVRLQPAWRQAERVLEHGEHRPFDGGRLVDTGHLRASLTQPFANDAIREAHADELVFGTSIPYARAAAHKAGEAALVLTAGDAREIADLTLHYIVSGL